MFITLSRYKNEENLKFYDKKTLFSIKLKPERQSDINNHTTDIKCYKTIYTFTEQSFIIIHSTRDKVLRASLVFYSLHIATSISGETSIHELLLISKCVFNL